MGKDILFQNINPGRILETYPIDTKAIQEFTVAQPYIQALELLILSQNDKHYHYYELMGMYYELQNELTKSKEFYEKSLSIIYEDPKLQRSDNQWVNIIKRIMNNIERVQSKIDQLQTSEQNHERQPEGILS